MNDVENVMAKKITPTSSWATLFLKMMSKINYGTISIITPDGESLHYRGAHSGAHASIRIFDWKFCEYLFLKGDIGLGEAYIDGLWDSDHINELIRFGIENKTQLERVIKGSFLRILFYRLKHLWNKNTKEGSRKNIHAHYDLGNEFYKLWLDRGMTYSSALFKAPTDELQTAQDQKYENILAQLEAKAGDHILEVGCGWGGFMEYAASKGIKVTGITISKEQFDFASKRLEGFGSLTTLKLMDYRDLSGQYDHIVSIEMFEAIGKEYWSTYFQSLNKVLKAHGKVVIQSITINDGDFLSYQKGSDFIQQYIFPGGMLPSPSAFLQTAKKSGFGAFGHMEFGKDYGKTLGLWEENFSASLSQIKTMGFDEKFIRTWRFYLKYCQGGFEAEKISVYQFYLSKKMS